MITVKNALQIVLKSIKILPKEEIRLTEGFDRVLAKDVYANVDIPQLDNSAMDGFAVRASDTKNASCDIPREFEVIEDLRAGYVSKKKLKPRQAIRIMTGAPIPKGADSVVMVENTSHVTRKKEFVKVFKEVKPGENVRKRGEDIKKGELVMKKGTILNSGHIGVLASLGKATIEVTKRPKVAILATGDEVIDVGEKMEPGKLRSSNTYTLYNQVLKCGGIPKNLGIAKDRPRELEHRIKKGLDCDMLLTSGGVSVGKYDFVKDVLAKLGTDIKFWKVRMRPGKPLVFGTISASRRRREIPIFGLPGNPVSSMISFEVFVKPTISKMLQEKKDREDEVEAILEEDIKKKIGFRYFLRARTEWKNATYHTHTTGAQGSGILKSMMLANSLIILPEEKEYLKKGTKVKVKFLG